MDKTKLLDRANVTGDDRLVLARVLDKQEQAHSRNVPAYTDFLSPAQQAQAITLLRIAGAREESYLVLGGYGGAERCILLFLPDWLDRTEAEPPLRCLRATFRPEFDLTHRDLLGSLMGLGIVREKTGDLLVDKTSCDLVVLDTVAEFLLQNWDSAGRAKLTVQALAPEDLCVPEQQCEEVRDTVSSLRLDAIAATGFRLARGKAAALVEGGKIQVNWQDCTKPDKLLAEGDVVTARGFGKFEVSTVGGVTRKGRTSIVLKRYL